MQWQSQPQECIDSRSSTLSLPERRYTSREKREKKTMGKGFTKSKRIEHKSKGRVNATVAQQRHPMQKGGITFILPLYPA